MKKSSFRKNSAPAPLGRAVSFDDKVPPKIILVQERDSYSEEERDALWYNKNEINKLQKEVKKIILNKTPLPQGDTDRGLEYHVACHRREMMEKEGKKDPLTKNRQRILAAARVNLTNRHSTKVNMEDLSRRVNTEAIMQSDMMAAIDTAEAYSVYLEDMEPEEVNKCFQDKRDFTTGWNA